jgi:hypothetical protein
MKIWSQVSLEMRSSSVFDTQQRECKVVPEPDATGTTLPSLRHAGRKSHAQTDINGHVPLSVAQTQLLWPPLNTNTRLALMRILTSHCRTCDTQNLQLTCDSASTSAILNCTFMQEIINPAEDRITCTPNWFRGHAILRSDGMG